MAKRAPLSYCASRQGRSDLNGWPWAAALQALIFPSAWPSGLEDEPSSERIMSISSEDLEQRQSGGGGIRTQKSHVPAALAHMICCPCLDSFSLSLFLREMVKRGDKALLIWRWDGSLGRNESCVEPHLARDCAHYLLFPSDVYTYLPIMPKISKDGEEGMGPRKVELP